MHLPTRNATARSKIDSSRLISLALLMALAVSPLACSQAEPTPTAIPPTATPTPAPTATPTATATATPTPTLTPTPAPLQPSQIFDLVSPAVLFIDTPTGTGSGVLISGGYAVTNAHVVWPFEEVRVVFSDGSEHTDVPVLNWDLMADLAVIGPIETDVDPLELVDGEALTIGSDVYLIGYPGEVDEFPVPTITRGLISRLRQWEPADVTFFQTDAMIAGGQSGGVLVSELGQVIGISGYTFSEAGFGLVASATDITPRIQGLIAGDDVDQLGDRRLPLEGGEQMNQALVYHDWDSRAFILNQPVGTEVEIKVTGTNDGAFVLSDALGYTVAYADDEKTGTERDTAKIELDAPYILNVYQYDTTPQSFEISSSHKLVPYNDVDDGKRVSLGQTVAGNIDYPGDVDVFEIDLKAGELANLKVDSILIDPYLIVDRPGDPDDHLVEDDDTGGGIFGLNAELTYEALDRGRFLIIVQDSYGYDIGGYWLTLDTPYQGAPTPVAPEPTPTPILTEFGRMARYQSQAYPFALEYPAHWKDEVRGGPFATICRLAAVCMAGEDGVLTIAEEDIEALGSSITLEEYMDWIVSNLNDTGSQVEVLSREKLVTAQGEPAEMIVIAMMDDHLRLIRFATIHQGLAFEASYVILSVDYGRLLPMIEYSFSTFQVTQLD